jgi:hypothetical protein
MFRDLIRDIRVIRGKKQNQTDQKPVQNHSKLVLKRTRNKPLFARRADGPTSLSDVVVVNVSAPVSLFSHDDVTFVVIIRDRQI